MSQWLINFARHGRIGDLQVGDSREQVLAKLGVPKDWLGKPVVVPENWTGDVMDTPMNFGPPVQSPEVADAWFYYNGAAGIYFETSGVSSHIYTAMPLTPDKPSDMVRGQSPFEDWPLSDHPTMGEVRDCLVSSQLRFREPEDKTEDDYFLVEDLCLIECWPYNQGKRLDFDDRYVSIIWRYRTVAGIPDYIKASRSS